MAEEPKDDLGPIEDSEEVLKFRLNLIKSYAENILRVLAVKSTPPQSFKFADGKVELAWQIQESKDGQFDKVILDLKGKILSEAQAL